MAYARAKWPDLFGHGGAGLQGSEQQAAPLDVGIGSIDGAMDAGLQSGGGWARTRALVRDYGVAGSVLVSAMPVVLHPLALFATAGGMPTPTLLASVLVGRTVKYFIFGALALAAPGLLPARLTRAVSGSRAAQAGGEDIKSQ